MQAGTFSCLTNWVKRCLWWKCRLGQLWTHWRDTWASLSRAWAYMLLLGTHSGHVVCCWKEKRRTRNSSGWVSEWMKEVSLGSVINCPWQTCKSARWLSCNDARARMKVTEWGEADACTQRFHEKEKSKRRGRGFKLTLFLCVSVISRWKVPESKLF